MPRNNNHTPQRFLVLDGLRGILALTVVVYHLFSVIYPSNRENPFHHAYLAVDFFFLLSGFVVAHAYDRRWANLSKSEFFKIRLIRLHPLVIAGLALGVAAYFISRQYGNTMPADQGSIFIMIFLQFFLLPSPDYIHGYPLTHPLNLPTWSLFQEYLVNLVYGLSAIKLTGPVLRFMLLISAVLLLLTGIKQGNLGGGWDWENFWIAPLRAGFSFFTGLYIYRHRPSFIPVITISVISVLLIGLLLMPTLPFNGIYDSVCIMIFFPLLLLAGATKKVHGVLASTCRFLGALSYPAYLLHYPVVTVFWTWVHYSPRNALELKVALSVSFIFILLLSLLISRFYDQPIRTWLSKIFLLR